MWDGESNKHSDCQRDILKPVSLTVEIHRNLSADWYHGMPTLSIDAKLNPLLVRVISKMYTYLLDIPRQPTCMKLSTLSAYIILHVQAGFIHVICLGISNKSVALRTAFALTGLMLSYLGTVTYNVQFYLALPFYTLPTSLMYCLPNVCTKRMCPTLEP